MEVKVNLVLLGLLAIVWASLSSADPVAALDPHADATQRLAGLEDEFAAHPDQIGTARELAAQYLDIGQPGLAIATIRVAKPELLEDAVLTHRLAQAYERTGRVLDALTTADLALARCARSLGTDGATETPVPRYECNEGTYASLDMHLLALEYMARWGVTQPMSDPRAALAYNMAQRSVRVAIVDVGVE